MHKTQISASHRHFSRSCELVIRSTPWISKYVLNPIHGYSDKDVLWITTAILCRMDRNCRSRPVHKFGARKKSKKWSISRGFEPRNPGTSLWQGKRRRLSALVGSLSEAEKSQEWGSLSSRPIADITMLPGSTPFLVKTLAGPELGLVGGAA